MKKLLLLGAFALSSFLTLQAQTIASFETAEGFTTGSIDEQNNWSLYGDTASENAVVTSEWASNGTQSLKLVSTNTQPDDLYGAFSPLYNIFNDAPSFEISQDVKTDAIDAVNGSDLYIYGFNYTTTLTDVSTIIFSYDGTIIVYDGNLTGDDAYIHVGTYTAGDVVTVKTRYNAAGTIDYYVNGEGVYSMNAYNGITLNLLGYLFDDYTTSYYVDNVVYNSELGTKNLLASKLSIFPNPASDVVTIANADNVLVSGVSIADINGRVVKTASFNGVANAQVNVSGLASGVYMMTITSDKGTTTKKIVKN